MMMRWFKQFLLSAVLFGLSSTFANAQATITSANKDVSVANNSTVALNTSVSASIDFIFAAPAGTGITGYGAKVEFLAPSSTLYTDLINGMGTGTVTPSKSRALNEVGVWKIRFRADCTWMDTNMHTGTVTDTPSEYTITVQ